MRPLIVLISSFLLCLLVTYAFYQQEQYYISGRIALAVMLLFTALAHFIFIKGMCLMMPPFVPTGLKKMVILITGLLEIAGAIGIMFQPTRVITGYALIAFFIAILPANIYAAQQKVNLEEGDHSGPGTHYLWIRIPFQILLIFWALFFCIMHPY